LHIPVWRHAAAPIDSLGIDATYELWDKTSLELADAVTELVATTTWGQRHDPAKERSRRWSIAEPTMAHVTGRSTTITREGKRLIGHNTDVPGSKFALDRLVGKQKMPRQRGPRSRRRRTGRRLWASSRGLQRIIVFNRHSRAEGLVKHFGEARRTMGVRAMPLARLGSSSRLAKTRILINATSIGLTSDETPIPPRRSTAICSCST